MNADNIEDLRMLSRSLKGQSWAAYWVRLTREAADELERLGKIEAAAKDFRRADTQIDSLDAFDRMAHAIKDNQCQTIKVRE